MADKPKHILVVSDPPAKPGYLPRLRFLCEYFHQKGYDVQLLTEEYQPLEFEHSYPIETIRMYSGSTLDWAIKTAWTLISDWHNRVFARRAILRNSKREIDYVVCTAFSDFPLGAAKRIARYYNVPLLCDIRDLDEQVDDSRHQYLHQQRWLMPFRKLYRAIHIRRRNQVLRTANAITTVSPWHADFIRPLNPNVHVVYNGYDDKQFFPKDITTAHFSVSYIGSLFEWQQPALEIIQQVINELNRQNQYSIQLNIHTPQKEPITYNRMGNAIRNSSIMLVLTATHTHGMLTTKFYEALGCEKPILCVPSDKGSLAELVDYTNAGIATDDKEQIKMFILDKYREWQTYGYTRQKTLHRNEFSRTYQTQKTEQLLKCL